MRKSVAVIGAGLAGLTLAQALRSSFDVVVFEKAARPGGRLATRRGTEHEFDHGAQYFSVRSPEMQKLIDKMLLEGIVAEWPKILLGQRLDGTQTRQDQTTRRYVAVPRMNTLAEALSDGLALNMETTISRIVSDNSRWVLETADGNQSQPFDLVISTAPAPQSLKLLPKRFGQMAELGKARMSGCFTLMIGLTTMPPPGFDAIRFEDPILSWLAVNSTKPRRNHSPSLVLHSQNLWADENMERDRREVISEMLDALARLTGLDCRCAPSLELHRWRYANVETPIGQPYLFDRKSGLAACGDWCLGNRVEAAFTSARALAEAILHDH